MSHNEVSSVIVWRAKRAVGCVVASVVTLVALFMIALNVSCVIVFAASYCIFILKGGSILQRLESPPHYVACKVSEYFF